MSRLEMLTAQLSGGHSLLPGEVADAAELLASAEIGGDEKAAFLTALAKKGETADEVAGFAREFASRVRNPGMGDRADGAIDVVGTGGDHAGGFNASSLTVFVLACAGVPVMKHGNRGTTSLCGSADLMAALGVDLQASSERQREALENLGFVFFFAPAYHPAFLHIAPVRKALAARGQRTIFNILGPLINPGRPGHILAGVFSRAWVSRIAAALGSSGSATGIAVHGELGQDFGIDELTTATVNHVRGFGRLENLQEQWRAGDFGLEPAPFSDLKGGDLEANLAVVESVLSGRGPRGLVDTVALNAAVGMWICGKAESIAQGIEPARDLLLGGSVRRKIADTRDFFRTKP